MSNENIFDMVVLGAFIVCMAFVLWLEHKDWRDRDE